MDVDFPKTEFTAEQREIIHSILKMQDERKPDFYNGIKFPKKK